MSHFGGLHGMDAAYFEEVWKAAKNGYNKAHEAHFQRFHADFLAHSKASKFHRWVLAAQMRPRTLLPLPLPPPLVRLPLLMPLPRQRCRASVVVCFPAP